MKQILIISLIGLFPFTALAQPTKWFFSLSTGASAGGPARSMFKELKAQGYDDVSETNFLGLVITSDYPKKYRNPAFLLKGGFRQKANRGYYFIAGIADKGTVEGFKETDPGSAFPFFWRKYRHLNRR